MPAKGGVLVMKQAYRTFEERTRELAVLKSILNALSWDQETMMPPRSVPHRARQLAALSAVYHRKLTDPKLGELLQELGQSRLDKWGRANHRELRRQHEKAVRLPETLVSRLAETTALAYQAWVEARQASDFPAFRPWLEKVLHLKRQEARCLQSTQTLYETLLDEYEPGMTVGLLDRLFGTLQPALTELLNKIQEARPTPPAERLKGHFPLDRQEAFGREVLTAMGFDWEAGRLDRSPHPFCSGLSPLDVRITTRYQEDDFAPSLFGIIHEGGHALYEQGLDPDRYGMPACDAISLGLHESQSRLWENQVARSRPFWEFWLPRLKGIFPGQLEALTLDQFVRAVNRVETTFIRVEADEVTYGLHVILRYRMEKAMIEGDLEAEALESEWNRGMKEYLGIAPPGAAQGVLQDTHWSQGLIGYFPTYLLGNLYAAHLFRHLQSALPDLENQICRGQLRPLREWLREKVHRPGKTVTATELLQRLGGAPLQAAPLLAYLETKYRELYPLND